MLQCRECGEEFNRGDMLFTRDCHGIPFRLVCHRCYCVVMRKGYDGRMYTQADIDEQIEPED